uniref:Uncharacterized protein n=1 Tax=Aegilops tauschii subsp. strangulata TaxID=200361 RepID=A0A453IJC5_AEGTS
MLTSKILSIGGQPQLLMFMRYCHVYFADLEMPRVEECGKRFSKHEQGGAQNEEQRAKELLGLVNEVFPRPPIKQEDELEVDMKDI